MASMSRTSTIMNLAELASKQETVSTECQPSQTTSIDFKPIEFISSKPSQPLPTIELESSSFSELSWIFQLITSHITLITISTLLTAIIYHAIYSVRSGVQDMCFNGSTSSSFTSAQAPLAEEACNSNSTEELMQWAELITPTLTPLIQKIWNAFLFPIAPLAFSFVIAYNTEKVKGWKSGSLAMLSDDMEREFKDAEPEPMAESEIPSGSLAPTERRPSLWVAERRGSFVVQYEEDDFLQQFGAPSPRPQITERRGSWMVQYDENFL